MSTAKMDADSTSTGDLSRSKKRKKQEESRHSKKARKTTKKDKENTDEPVRDDLNLDIPLYPMSSYLKERSAMVEQLFYCVSGPSLHRSLPDVLKNMPLEALKARCLQQLEVMSRKRIRRILEGDDPAEISSSGTEDDTDTEQTVATADAPTEKAQDGEEKEVTENDDKSTEKESEVQTEVVPVVEEKVDTEMETDKVEEEVKDKDDDTKKSEEKVEENEEKKEDEKVAEEDKVEEKKEEEKPPAPEEPAPPTQMEILELEMRARAIKAMLKSQVGGADSDDDDSDKERDKRKKKSSDERKDSKRGSPERKTKSRDSPDRKDRSRGSPDRKDRSRNSPDRKDKSRSSPDRKDKSRSSPDRKDKSRSSPDRKDKSRSSPDRKDRSRDSPDRKLRSRDSPDKSRKSDVERKERSRDSPDRREKSPRDATTRTIEIVQKDDTKKDVASKKDLVNDKAREKEDKKVLEDTKDKEDERKMDAKKKETESAKLPDGAKSKQADKSKQDNLKKKGADSMLKTAVAEIVQSTVEKIRVKRERGGNDVVLSKEGFRQTERKHKALRGRRMVSDSESDDDRYRRRVSSDSESDYSDRSYDSRRSYSDRHSDRHSDHSDRRSDYRSDDDRRRRRRRRSSGDRKSSVEKKSASDKKSDVVETTVDKPAHVVMADIGKIVKRKKKKVKIPKVRVIDPNHSDSSMEEGEIKDDESETESESGEEMSDSADEVTTEVLSELVDKIVVSFEESNDDESMEVDEVTVETTKTESLVDNIEDVTSLMEELVQSVVWNIISPTKPPVGANEGPSTSVEDAIKLDIPSKLEVVAPQPQNVSPKQIIANKFPSFSITRKVTIVKDSPGSDHSLRDRNIDAQMAEVKDNTEHKPMEQEMTEKVLNDEGEMGNEPIAKEAIDTEPMHREVLAHEPMEFDQVVKPTAEIETCVADSSLSTVAEGRRVWIGSDESESSSSESEDELEQNNLKTGNQSDSGSSFFDEVENCDTSVYVDADIDCMTPERSNFYEKSLPIIGSESEVMLNVEPEKPKVKVEYRIHTIKLDKSVKTLKSDLIKPGPKSKRNVIDCTTEVSDKLEDDVNSATITDTDKPSDSIIDKPPVSDQAEERSVGIIDQPLVDQPPVLDKQSDNTEDLLAETTDDLPPDMSPNFTRLLLDNLTPYSVSSNDENSRSDSESKAKRIKVHRQRKKEIERRVEAASTSSQLQKEEVPKLKPKVSQSVVDRKPVRLIEYDDDDTLSEPESAKEKDSTSDQFPDRKIESVIIDEGKISPKQTMSPKRKMLPKPFEKEKKFTHVKMISEREVIEDDVSSDATDIVEYSTYGDDLYDEVIAKSMYTEEMAHSSQAHMRQSVNSRQSTQLKREVRQIVHESMEEIVESNNEDSFYTPNQTLESDVSKNMDDDNITDSARDEVDKPHKMDTDNIVSSRLQFVDSPRAISDLKTRINSPDCTGSGDSTMTLESRNISPVNENILPSTSTMTSFADVVDTTKNSDVLEESSRKDIGKSSFASPVAADDEDSSSSSSSDEEESKTHDTTQSSSTHETNLSSSNVSSDPVVISSANQTHPSTSSDISAENFPERTVENPESTEISEIDQIPETDEIPETSEIPEVDRDIQNARIVAEVGVIELDDEYNDMSMYDDARGGSNSDSSDGAVSSSDSE